MATIIEKIKQALARRDGVPEGVMRELADAYSADVTRVNERLSQAVAMLHKGLRSEAIQMVSLAPNALDAAAALDFPEFQEWCEILQFFGIPTPDELQRDLADQLNEAIVESQPLEGLLRQHRRLAIARAPLPWRLKVLRNIADQDPMNGVWEDDLEAWETARVKQLHNEVAQAVAANDPASLSKLYQELTQTSWRVNPDAGLHKKVMEALRKASDAAVIEELAAIAPAVHDAFCQFDEPAARQALAKWDAAVNRLSIAPPPELAEQVEGAAQWVEEIDREAARCRERNTALGKLESAIDQGANRATLDAAYSASARFDEPLPEDLVQRYRLAVEHLELAAARRNQAILVAIAACTLLAIGAIVYWQRSALYERSIAAAEASFNGMLEGKRIMDAQVFWSRLQSESPHLAADVRLVSLFGKLEAMVSEESVRVAEFAEYLRLADVEDRKAMDHSALAKAEGLAVSEDEKAAAFKVRRRYSQWDRELDAEQTDALLARLAEVRQRLDQVEQLAVDTVPSRELVNIISAIDELPSKFPRAGAAAKSQITTARTRATAIRDTLRERRERIQWEAAAVARIVKSTSLDEMASQLSRYSGESSGSPLGKEFAQVAGERPHWDQPQAWNDFAAAAADVLEQPFVTSAVEDLIKQESLLRAKLGENPAESDTGLWQDRIHRYAERQAILKQVLGELGDTVIADLYTIMEKEGAGNRYFIYHFYHDRNRSLFSHSRRSLEVVVNASGAVSITKPLDGPFKVAREPQATIQWLTGVYQSSASKFGKDWEREFLKLVGQLRNRTGLDRQLKEMLVQHLLAGACQGSNRLASELVQELLLLRDRGSERERWYEPTAVAEKLDASVESAVIKKVAELYRQLPDVSDEAKRLRARQYTWIGCLTRDATGGITAAVKRSPDAPGKLLIAEPSASEPGKTDLVAIGAIAGGRPVLNGAPAHLVAGRPIYFCPN